MKILFAGLCFALCLVAVSQDRTPVDSALHTQQAPAPMTQEQGEEILNELRLIRKSLEDRAGSLATRSPSVFPSQGLKIGVDPGWFALGSETAPVTVVEFADFQCPYCGQFNRDTFPKIKATYINTGKVRFVSREYPLESHPDAMRAALAAHCAGTQGRYWQMHDSISAANSELSPEALERDARDLGIDMRKYKACVEDESSAAAIQRDVSEGQSIGVTGTPAFLIGNKRGPLIEGVRIDGAKPYAAFASAIDAALSASR